ncbi:hypothetical protein FACS1894155_07590 [Bacteroidia bacterium]|nr:hypothetical protein FACS1894155_07590 [Bacteroidia bacterium]
MKTKYILTIITIAIIGNCWVLKSQELPQMIPPSSKASSILKYGEYPVSLYTGLVDITVPIYTIDVKGIKVPIEFKYHASGIKYDDISLEVGLGWSLIAGGTIDYTVRGSQDNRNNPNTFIKNIADIIPAGMCNSLDNDIYGLADIANGNKLYPESSFGVKDGESDIYNYSFLQYSGQYCIPYPNSGPSGATGSSGEIFIPANPLKLVGWGSPELLDDKGISYRFEQMESGDYGRHKTYYLTKIISADKADTILFNYTYYPDSYGNGILRPYIDKSITIIDNSPRFYSSGSFPGPVSSASESGGLTTRTYYSPRLNNIIFKGGRVVFEYYNNIPTSRDLRTVKIYNNISSSPLQTISLVKGQFAENRGDRLDQVIFQNSQGDSYDYQFEYNGNPGINFGANSREGIDYWGYYNGRFMSSNDVNYLPNFVIPYIASIGSRQLSNLDRSADETAMQKGMLKKIVYPTKGYTEFKYEAHRALDRIYGGLRIKEILNYKEDGSLSEKKWYRYGAYESGEGRAAAYPKEGDFMRETRVLEQYGDVYYNTLGKVTYLRQYSCFPKQSYFTSGSSVVYSQVTEYTGNGTEDIGKTIYQFEDFPEQQYEVGETTDIETASYGTVDMPVRTYTWKNGKLISKETFKKVNGVYSSVYSLINDYTDINTAEYENLRVIPYITTSYYNPASGYSGGDQGILVCFDQPVYDEYKQEFDNGVPFYYFNYYYTTGLRVLSSSTETIDGISKQTYYDEYNSYGFPKSVRTNLSSDDNRVLEYKYPSDFSTVSPYNEMLEKNIVSPVIEAAEYKNTDTFLKKTVNNYFEPYANMYLPSSLQTQQGTHAVETRVNYAYNPKGDLIEASKDNADQVVYLWGYNRQYPVAKIENATYAQVVGAFSGGQAAINALETATNPDMTPVNNLRNTLTDALVTTYTYKPLVGMLSVTDPRGVKTTYEYDDFGRLKTIKDHNNSVVESYNYNYRNQ